MSSVALAALLTAVVGAGCGSAEEDVAPIANTPRVSLTITYPGYAPWALITYRDARDRTCHAIGAITPHGPRVVDLVDRPLGEGLASRGQCLTRTGGDVSLQVRRGVAGGPRLVGGLARRGVRRVIIAGQTIRPRRDGGFLIALPADGGPIGGEVELDYASGHRRTVPLRAVRT